MRSEDHPTGFGPWERSAGLSRQVPGLFRSKHNSRTENASGGRCLGSGPRASFPSTEKYPLFPLRSSLRPSPVGRGERVGAREAESRPRSARRTRPVRDKCAIILLDNVPLVLQDRRKGILPCPTPPNRPRATPSVSSSGTWTRTIPPDHCWITFRRRRGPANGRLQSPNRPATRKSVDYHRWHATVASPLPVVEPDSGRSRSMRCMRGIIALMSRDATVACLLCTALSVRPRLIDFAEAPPESAP